MSLVVCPDCKSKISDAATSCPVCGRPNDVSSKEGQSPSESKPSPADKSDVRPVGALLGIGILLMPVIFSWFTLRKGHSTRARVISFAWLAIAVAIALAPNKEKPITSQSKISSETKSTANESGENIKSSKTQVEQQKNEIKVPRLKTMEGSKYIIVWKSKEAFDEALSIISSGVNESNRPLLENLIACRADAGTKVAVTDAGFATHDILVVDGPNSGCRGNIPQEELEYE